MATVAPGQLIFLAQSKLSLPKLQVMLTLASQSKISLLQCKLLFGIRYDIIKYLFLSTIIKSGQQQLLLLASFILVLGRPSSLLLYFNSHQRIALMLLFSSSTVNFKVWKSFPYMTRASYGNYSPQSFKYHVHYTFYFL